MTHKKFHPPSAKTHTNFVQFCNGGIVSWRMPSPTRLSRGAGFVAAADAAGTFHYSCWGPQLVTGFHLLTPCVYPLCCELNNQYTFACRGACGQVNRGRTSQTSGNSTKPRLVSSCRICYRKRAPHLAFQRSCVWGWRHGCRLGLGRNTIEASQRAAAAGDSCA